MKVRKILDDFQLKPQRKWSQSFLVSESIADRIVVLAQITSEDTVIEIGTGLGILTKALSQRAKQVLTWEVDTHLNPYLKETFANISNVQLLEGDFLKVDLSTLRKEFPSIKIVANLPFHISTEILFRLFEHRSWIHSMTLMFQKEVAARIVARPATKAYGVVSVLSQLYAKPRLCIQVARQNFFPIPKVAAAVVHFQIKSERLFSAQDEQAFVAMVKQAFCKRRKVITNALADWVAPDRLGPALMDAGISPKSRIEDFDAPALNQLFEVVQNCRSQISL